MKTLIRNGKALAYRHRGIIGAVSTALVATAAHAQATTPTAPAYADMVNGGKTELYGAITTVGPVVFGLLGVMLAIRWSWSKFSRAAQG